MNLFARLERPQQNKRNQHNIESKYGKLKSAECGHEIH